jgi:O-6-methylguanine DNA methyltransferase
MLSGEIEYDIKSNVFYYETQIGKITIVDNGTAITNVCFGEVRNKDTNIIETPLLKKAYEQIQEYLNGKRSTFELPLAPQGTEFQQNVWKALQEIPYGKTNSYKDVAKNIGNINASRAVGMANNKNPILLFIPCHRVIGANGKLVGYAGGLDIKEKLLEIEKQKANVFFKYNSKEIAYLKQADAKLGEAIDRLGRVERVIIKDLFTALIFAIIGQQISVKAVNTIWNRVQERFGEITPENISKISINEIQQCGMTTRKAGYIRSISDTVSRGDLNLNEFNKLSDKEVISQLSSLHGIGIWTAEMLLLNSMERPNIVSWGDMAIRRGMMKLYGLSELTKEQFDEYKKRYSPYGSVASIYLWKISTFK